MASSHQAGASIKQEPAIMFAKFSIRAKITSVVAFLLVAMTGMGLLAVRDLRAINANTVDISTNWLVAIRALGDLRAGVITYRNVIREHMLAETIEEKQAAEKTLAGGVWSVDSNEKSRRIYEATIAPPQERELYNQWVATWNRYKQGAEQVMALSRKEAGQASHEAHELNTKTVNKTSLEADAILKKDIALNNSGSDKAAAYAASTYNSAFMWVVAILGLAVVVGGAIGLYLIR